MSFAGFRINASENISYIFSLLSGIIIGVATGLLATKLSSRILNLPLWSVSFLVVSTVIQAVFPIIAQSGEGLQSALSLVIAMIAFYGKVFLLIVVHWARDTNRLVYYMVRARQIYDEEEDAQFRALFMFTAQKLRGGNLDTEEGEPASP